MANEIVYIPACPLAEGLCLYHNRPMYALCMDVLKIFNTRCCDNLSKAEIYIKEPRHTKSLGDIQNSGNSGVSIQQ